MAIVHPPKGATIGWYVYKQELVGRLECPGIGYIPSYANITPLTGTLYASRDAARRAARKLTDAQRRKPQVRQWEYDFSAAKESDAHLFARIPQTVTR